MENTSNYLQKEIISVEGKIDSAKAILLKELKIEILENDSQYGLTHAENLMIEKEIREEEEEYDEDEDEGDADENRIK